MTSLGYAEAFGRYGATLRNVQWSVCATAPDGSLIVSLWEHHFSPPRNGTISASGRFDRWRGPGNMEFRARVLAAFSERTPVKVVISHTDQPDDVERGADASYLKNTFSVREDWIGVVSRVTDDEYEFEFRKVEGP